MTLNKYQTRVASDPIFAAREEFGLWTVHCERNARSQNQGCRVFYRSAPLDGTMHASRVNAEDVAASAAMVAAIGVAIGPGLRRVLVAIADHVVDYEKLPDDTVAIDMQFGADENSSMPITAGEVRNLAKWAAGLSAPPFEDVRGK